MIDSKFHVELDGVKYRLAESAQGQHHNVRGEPLRPPNAVTVQGESQQKFQPRPEVLLWNWTDWSQGEGLRTLRFGPQYSGRSWELNGVRAFEEPGHLIPGYYVEVCQDSTGLSDFTVDCFLVAGNGNLYAVARGSGATYKWETDRFAAATTPTGGGGGHDDGIGDEDAIYVIANGGQTVRKWDGVAGSYTNLSTTLIGSTNRQIDQVDDYVYVYRPESAKVWEIAKTGSTPTVIDSWTSTGRWMGDNNRLITSLDGRIYVLVTQSNRTNIREITPTSASGTGFGAEIARLPGFQGESMWAHSGTLFILGRYRDDGDSPERTVLYLTPGGEYGSLGKVRPDDVLLSAAGGDGRMLDHFFVTERRAASGAPNHTLFQIDSISGGIAAVGYDETGDATGEDPATVVQHKGDIFWTTVEGAGTNRVMRADASRYLSDGNAISPEHDFDLVSEKFLSSLVLSTEPMPANWTVHVDYQINGSGTWTNVISYTTDGGTGTTTAVTTDSSTVEFKRLQLRVRFEYTGAGVPSTAPVVLGVEARAVVATKVKVFQILLDLSTDQSAGRKSNEGASKVDSFLATAVKATSVDYKDGYTSPRSGEYDQYDVFVDDYNVVLDRPGEGMAAVTLREVI